MVKERKETNNQTPLLDKRHQADRIVEISEMREESQSNLQQQHQSMSHRCYTVFIDLINMLMCSTEIALVLYLTVHHFTDSMGVIAVAMLAPILLNFVGVNYFFSDNNERIVFEKVGTTRFSRDLLQIPVLGPVFTAIKVLMISTGLTNRSDIEYERFEASAVKMRACQTFFSAAPEAMVQLSVLLNSSSRMINKYHILEIIIVIVSIFTLAEANVYALRSNYFRLFQSHGNGDWHVHETFGRKCILFLHSFCSIGSRIAAAACLIAGAQCFVRRRNEDMKDTMMRKNMMANHNIKPMMTSTTRSWGSGPVLPTSIGPPDDDHDHQLYVQSTDQLGFIIGVFFVCLILYHMLVYYIARLMRYSVMRQDIPGGCYESINYGWRSSILHTGFQSKNIATQAWFYLENCAMFTLWWFSVQYYADEAVRGNSQLPMTLIFTAVTVLSLFFLFAAVGSGMHRLESPFTVRNGQKKIVKGSTDN